MSLLAGPARADDPVIHVRARQRLDVDAIERIDKGLEVRGFLRDDGGDEPIAGRTVAISIEGANGFYEYAEPAHPDGSFRFRAPLPLGTYRLRLFAGGDGDYVAAPTLERSVDVAKRTPTLTLTAPDRLPANAHTLHLVVEGREREECPTGDNGELESGGCPPRALQGPLGFVSIGGKQRVLDFHEGRVELDEIGPFGEAGQRLELVARIHGSPLRNEISTRRMVLLTSATWLTLDAAASEISLDGQAALAGALRDEHGAVAGARIGIGVENGPDLTEVVSDGNGQFHASLRARALPHGDAFVEARFHPSPSEDWREPSVSPTVPLRVLGARPISSWPYVVSPLVTLLIGGVWLAARDRRWRRWIVRKARRRRVPVSAPTVGLTESRPGLLSSLRGRADHGLTGIVVDAADDRAIPTATVRARTAAGEARAATVDGEGRFAFEDLPAGPLVVEIAAPGYVAERFSRTLPHRGELRGARVRLIPVRARIFAAWQRAARPLYPMPRAADTWTPRELLSHVESRSILPHETLAELTALVESTVWGAHAPSDEDLAIAERLAANVTGADDATTIDVLPADPSRRS